MTSIEVFVLLGCFQPIGKLICVRLIGNGQGEHRNVSRGPEIDVVLHIALQHL